MKDYIVGIDFGGTKIQTALFDGCGNIVHKLKVETDNSEGYKTVLKTIFASIRKIVNESGKKLSQICGIGIAAPGPLNVLKGKIEYLATLNWKNVPIRDLLIEEFNVPVFLENDCNAAAYAELFAGAGKGYKDLIYVTISTGVGSGIIIDKKIYHGKHDSAGEFGHICIEPEGRLCACGKRGCLQAYSSGTSIMKIAHEKLQEFNESELMPAQNTELDGVFLADAAKKADPLATEVFMQAGEKLGHGISILLQLFDPDIVILGGGVSKSLDCFYQSMMQVIEKHTYKHIYEDALIVPAQLGMDAPLVGAAMLTARELGQKWTF